MTMLLFAFTANPLIEYPVDLPVMTVIAETEAQARELADQQCPVVTARRCAVETNIVGVRVTSQTQWEHPFLHEHLTQCCAEPVTPGCVRYGSDDFDDGA